MTLKQFLRNTIRAPLYANSVYLMVNSVLAAALGFVFWTIVARLYPPQDVGLGSALISAGTLLAFIASLGLGTGLIRFLPGVSTDKSKLVNSSVTVSVLASIIVAGVFLAGIPWWSPAFSSVRQDFLFSGLFVIFVVATTTLDRLAEVSIAQRRGGFVLLQYTTAGLTKVALLFVLAARWQVLGILASCVAAVVLALGVSLPFLPRLLPGYRPVPSLDTRGTGKMFRFSLGNYIGATFWNLPHWLLPVLIVNILGKEEGAYFYMSWYVAWFLHSIPSAASTSLFVEGSHDSQHVKSDVKRSLMFVALLLLPAAVIIFILGSKLLLIFGAEYSQSGEKVLRLLVPASIPLAINMVYIGIARVREKLRNIVVLSVGVAVGTLLLSFLLLESQGIIGPAIAWLVSNSVAAVIVLPSIVKLLRSDSGGDTKESGLGVS